MNPSIALPALSNRARQMHLAMALRSLAMRISDISFQNNSSTAADALWQPTSWFVHRHLGTRSAFSRSQLNRPSRAIYCSARGSALPRLQSMEEYQTQYAQWMSQATLSRDIRRCST